MTLQFVSYKRCISLVVLSLLLFVGNSIAAVFILKNSDVASINEDLSKVFVASYNAKILPLKFISVTESSSKNIHKILLQEELLIAGNMPVSLDSMMCDLNSHVCERDYVVSFQSSEKSNSALDPTPTSWDISPADELLIPAAKVVRSTSWINIGVKSGGSVEKTVISVLGGCTTWDDKCRRQIQDYNPKKGDAIFSDEFEGELTLPKLTGTVQFVDRNDSGSSELMKVMRPADKHILLKKVDDNLYYIENTISVDPVLGKVEEQSKVSNSICRSNSVLCDKIDDEDAAVDILYDQAIDESLKLDDRFLRGRAVGSGSISRFSNHAAFIIPNDIEGHRASQIKWMNFPYDKIVDYPGAAGLASVAIFDSWIDEHHCAFAPALAAGKLTVHNKTVHDIPDRVECDEQSIRSMRSDHGTWIAGIFTGEMPIEFGFNPMGNLVTYELDYSALKSSDYTLNLAAQIGEAYTKYGAKVINMSFGYVMEPPAENSSIGSLGAVDLIQRKIQEQVVSLFVAASGNYGMDLSNICDIRPACFDYPNVISVAALDTRQQDYSIWQEDGEFLSNYGENIHVAAPGVDIFSSISGGGFGTMSGSSQATPMVSVVASIYRALFPNQTPLEVKNRIIYCSSNVGKYIGQLFGGELNAACVLDAETAFYTSKEDRNDKRKFGMTYTELRFRTQLDGISIAIPSPAIRAIHFVPKTKTYTVYYTRNPNDKDTTLLKETGLKFEEEIEIELIDDVGNIVHLNNRDLFNYVAAY